MSSDDCLYAHSAHCAEARLSCWRCWHGLLTGMGSHCSLALTLAVDLLTWNLLLTGGCYALSALSFPRTTPS
jgi:hypothetical protein